LSDGFDDAGIPHAAKRFDGSGADPVVVILQKQEQSAGRTAVTDLTKGFNSGDADMIVIILESSFQWFNSRDIAGFTEGIRDGATVWAGFVSQHPAKGINGDSAILGSIFMLAHGDGTKDKFSIGFGAPAESIESVGCLPANVVVAVFKRGDQGGNGAGVREGAQGLSRLGTDFRVAIDEGRSECGDCPFILELTKTAGCSHPDLMIFILEGVADGFKGA
jgi:hypothetical protein